MLCYSLLYSKVNLLYMYIYPFFFFGHAVWHVGS